MSACFMSSANYHCDFSDISDDKLVSATQLIDSVRFLVSNYNRYVGRVNEAAYSSGCWHALSSVSGYYGIYGKHAAIGRWYLEYTQVCNFLRVRGLRLLHFWRSFNLLDVRIGVLYMSMEFGFLSRLVRLAVFRSLWGQSILSVNCRPVCPLFVPYCLVY